MAGLAGALAATLAAQAPQTVGQVLDRALAREHSFPAVLARFRPRIETYIQGLGPDRDRGTVPVSDAYYLGILDASHGWSDVLFTGTNLGPLAHEFYPVGFAGMISPDNRRFDRAHYDFRYQGRDFLGAVRCYVFDVTPRAPAGRGSFIGRIWVEDQGYALVRFDGTYVPNPRHHYVHFDSWRSNMGPGLWLPVDIYSQEQDQPTGLFGHINFKAQTRFWGYALSAGLGQSSMAEIVADPASDLQDPNPPPTPRSPLEREREWQSKAETDVLRRMEEAGLLAPPGPVDAVLDTVVRNLEITNHLAFSPPVHCRVLLTAPMESFTVGHTIVLSRGLIDVLPDEASLAMMLAHELGHIALGQGINTDYAFDDRMMFSDEQSFRRLRMARTPEEEAAADAKGLAILENSPYRNQLASAGLFLEALQRAAKGLPNLISPHLGNALVLSGRVERMQALLARAPQLQVRDLRQIPALPLGARIELDAWSDQLALLPPTADDLLSPRDKLSFEITPLLPWLRREPAAADN